MFAVCFTMNGRNSKCIPFTSLHYALVYIKLFNSESSLSVALTANVHVLDIDCIESLDHHRHTL